MKNEGRKKWMTASDRKRQAEDTILRITSNAICGPLCSSPYHGNIEATELGRPYSKIPRELSRMYSIIRIRL